MITTLLILSALLITTIVTLATLFFKHYIPYRNRYIELLHDHIQLCCDIQAQDCSDVRIKDKLDCYVLYRHGLCGNEIEIISIPYIEIDRDFKFQCAQECADMLNDYIYERTN